MGINDMSNQLLGISGGGLKTTDKNALIDIANAADTSNTSINIALTNAIGSPTVNGESYTNIITDINTQKSNLATRLVSRGVTAIATETLKALVDKISNIVYGGICVANDIRTGKSAVVNGVLISGTMNLTNLIASNVKSGVVIDGITGTLIDGTGMKKYASGTATSAVGALSFLDASNGISGAYPLSITGLTFTPSTIMICKTLTTPVAGGGSMYRSGLNLASTGTYACPIAHFGSTNAMVSTIQLDGTTAYVNATGFRLPVGGSNLSYNWYATE